MSSQLYLSSYVLYKSALTAFLDIPESERIELLERDVMRAYARATADLPKRDESEFIEFAQRVLVLPRKSQRAAADRAHNQWMLDHAIAASGQRLVEAGRLICNSEFLQRTGMSQELLDEKLAMREIFEMSGEPECSNGKKYIPAFFADRRFDARVLYAVSGSLGTCTGVQKFRFFTSAVEFQSNRTVLDLIELKQLETLLPAVKAFRANFRKR